MNKLLIVLLAVCLISVHGFVKRDATQGGMSNMEEVQKKISDFTSDAQKAISSVMNSDQIKKSLEDTKKFFDDLQKKFSQDKQ